MSVSVPWIGEVETLNRNDIRALLELPKTVARFNNALVTFAESVERFDRLVRRIDQVSRPLEAPLGTVAERLERSSEDLGTALSSLDRVADSLEHLTPRIPGALAAWRRRAAGPPGSGDDAPPG